jgi:hypothetical protein
MEFVTSQLLPRGYLEGRPAFRDCTRPFTTSLARGSHHTFTLRGLILAWKRKPDLNERIGLISPDNLGRSSRRILNPAAILSDRIF